MLRDLTLERRHSIPREHMNSIPIKKRERESEREREREKEREREVRHT
jgi:hypothetical protein